MNKAAVEEWVQSRLTIISQSGDEVVAKCPQCNDPKLSINVSKGVVICFKGCFSGNISFLAAKVEGCTVTEARDRMADVAPRTTQSLRERFESLRPVNDQISVYQPLPKDFQPCFDGRQYRIPSYVEDPLPEGRGLDDDALRLHGIGFALRGRYQDRLIVPVHCEGNRTFQARIMGKPSEFKWTDKLGKVREPPKYRSPRDANIGSFLYWKDNVPEGVDVILVEGVFDVIRLVSLGFYAVANFGKRVTKHQIEILRRMRPKSVMVMYDAGATADGFSDAWKVKTKFGKLPVKVAKMRGDDDPDLLGFRDGRRGVLRLLRRAKPVTSKLDMMRAALKEIA